MQLILLLRNTIAIGNPSYRVVTNMHVMYNDSDSATSF